jgi:hypothetical protein
VGAAERMANFARIGRAVAHSPEARAKEANTQRRNATAQHSWSASSQPAWLTEQVFTEKIQPLLVDVPTSVIAKRLHVSRWYAGEIRKGYRPHPRHWQVLAKLAGYAERTTLGEPESHNLS